MLTDTTASINDTPAWSLKKINQILHSGGGAGGGVSGGNADPVDPPGANEFLWVRQDTGQVWYNDGSNWQPLIA